MTLEQYLAAPGSPNLTEFAAMLGVSKGRLSQIKAAGEWPAELAMKAEEQTLGALCASDLSATVARARGVAA